MNCFPLARLYRLGATVLLVTLASGCGLLQPATTPQPALYSLDSPSRTAVPVVPIVSMVPMVRTAVSILIVNPPRAAAGFDSSRIIYTREPHKLEYFAHSEWVDPPARMLAPLVVAAIENTGAFRAVIPTPSAATGDLRLDTEIIRLQHEFGTTPSRVHFTLRAYIVDHATRRVLAQREFDVAVPATSEDPYGGVVAANRAVQIVLEDLSAFCATEARIDRVDK